MGSKQKLKLPAGIAIRCNMGRKTPQHTPRTLWSPEWPWDDSLDALEAAPLHHRKIFENDRVRALEVLIPAGAMVPVHTHRWPGILHLQSWSEHVRRDETGKLLFDSRDAGRPPVVPSVVWCEPLPPHSVENVGEAELRVLSIELKDPTAG